jgi:hypothetical protein
MLTCGTHMIWHEYVCTADEDMIMTRVRTTGIVLTDFEEKPYSYSVSSTVCSRYYAVIAYTTSSRCDMRKPTDLLFNYHVHTQAAVGAVILVDPSLLCAYHCV